MEDRMNDIPNFPRKKNTCHTTIGFGYSMSAERLHEALGAALSTLPKNLREGATVEYPGEDSESWYLVWGTPESDAEYRTRWEEHVVASAREAQRIQAEHGKAMAALTDLSLKPSARTNAFFRARELCDSGERIGLKLARPE